VSRYRCLFALPPVVLLLALLYYVRDRVINAEDDWPINPSYYDYEDRR
jgi:hypothetical protein